MVLKKGLRRRNVWLCFHVCNFYTGKSSTKTENR
jgi:hypothetical protein